MIQKTRWDINAMVQIFYTKELAKERFVPTTENLQSPEGTIEKVKEILNELKDKKYQLITETEMIILGTNRKELEKRLDQVLGRGI
jgi:uncharacterized membrane protein YheB (UPF0754 family)